MRTETLITALAIVGLASLVPQVRAASSPVSIEAVSIVPQSPGPGVLCTLGVKIKNAGSHAATDFRFKVKIDGQDVDTYKIQSFSVSVEPGASNAISLYSFWSPATAKAFTVEVTVLEGRWADVTREGNTTTTTPIGPIDGLPVSATQSVTMGATK